MTNLCTVLQTDVGGVSADVGRKLQQVSTVENGFGSGTAQLAGNSELAPGLAMPCRCRPEHRMQV